MSQAVTAKANQTVRADAANWDKLPHIPLPFSITSIAAKSTGSVTVTATDKCLPRKLKLDPDQAGSIDVLSLAVGRTNLFQGSGGIPGNDFATWEQPALDCDEVEPSTVMTLLVYNKSNATISVKGQLSTLPSKYVK